MPHCCAVGCLSATHTGNRLYAIPNGKHDQIRRQIWLRNIRRTHFNPKKGEGRLCQEHFDNDQFERMIPGKLKPNAIPTLFNYNAHPVRRKYTKRQSADNISPSPGKRIRRGDEISGEGSASGTAKENYTTRVRKVYSSNTMEDDGSQIPLTSIDPQDVDNTKRCLNTKVRTGPVFKKMTSLPRKGPSSRFTSTSPKIKKKIQVTENYLGSFLNQHQMKALNMSSVTWSEAAIKKALQLRFSCGYNGYNVLREQGLPLPTDETLRRKLEPIPFKNGLLTDIFQFLQSRVQSLEEHEKRVSLTLHEIAINPGLEWDERGGCIVGFPTVLKSKDDPSLMDYDMETITKAHYKEVDLDEDNDFDNLAISAIVFMLRGVASSWKQIVAYEFIGESFNSTVMKDMILSIISNCHEIGLDVKNVTMDIGDGGQAILRHFGITHGRIGDITNTVPHPVVARNKLQFFASFPHLLKSLRDLLSSAEEIFLPETIAMKYDLPTSVVNLTHVQMMMRLDEQHNLRLAPHLKPEYLHPRHFEKYCVQPAQRLFSQQTVNAIRFLVNQKFLTEDALTTAWFFEQIADWYETVTSRCPSMAQSRYCIEKLNRTVKNLSDFNFLILNMNIGRKNAARKRIQKEIYISTSSIAMNKNDYYNAGDCIEGYNQNCLENLLCLVRFRNSIPTALEFKNSLRVFCLFQLLKGSSRQNCVVDPSVNLPSNLLHHLDGTDAKEVACIKYKSPILQLSKLDENNLYNLCVYCVTRFIRMNQNCFHCVKFLVSRGGPSIEIPREKCYSPDLHTYACVHVFRFLELAEKTVLEMSESVIRGGTVLSRLMERTLGKSQQIAFPNCHKVKEAILKWYLSARIFSFSKEKIDVQS